MLKKGQIEHAFGLIIFIIAAGFLLLMGYEAISNLLSDSCELEKNAFREEIKGYFSKYDDYESIHREQVNLPCNYYAICFVDGSVYEGADSAWIPQDPLIAGDTPKQVVIETAKEVKFNIFLIGEFAEPLTYSEKVMVDYQDRRDLCIREKGTANLVFKGKGSRTLVEES